MTRRRVLIADDDSHMRAALGRLLSHWGYRVSEAVDGLGVLRECIAGQVDAILLDNSMPNGDGQSIARIIRNESGVPIVFISGCPPREFDQIQSELPDIHFLPKPVDVQELEILLSTLTRSKEESAAAG